VLGGKVDQRGSLVNPEKLRFDFTNSGPVKPDQCAKVEEIVRAQIAAGYQIYTQVGLAVESTPTKPHYFATLRRTRLCTAMRPKARAPHGPCTPNSHSHAH
jgi:hypothetical protein